MKRLCALLSLLALWACSDQQPISFYHWKAAFAPAWEERTYLDSLEENVVYLKAMNVLWNPYGESEEITESLRIKPDSLKFVDALVLSIWISPEVLLNMPEAQWPAFAARTGFELEQILKRLARDTDVEIREVHVDLDWDPEVEVGYFSFLSDFQKIVESLGIPSTSVAVRLHQLDLEVYGVPPVNKALLQHYQLPTIRQPELQPDIFTADWTEELEDRLKAYPLALDLCLPLSDHGLLYRNGMAIRFFPYLSDIGLMESGCCPPSETKVYEVRTSTYVQNHWTVVGDSILLRTQNQADVQRAYDRMKDARKKFRVVYSPLDFNLLRGRPFAEVRDYIRLD